MAEYIDRQAAISIPLLPKEHRYYQTLNLDDAFDRGWNAAMECVRLIPTADVRENVKGKWIKSQRDEDFVVCSNCKNIGYRTAAWRTEYAERIKFCPNCGADMRGNYD